MHLKGNGFYSEIVYLLLPVPTNKNFNFEFEPKEDISKDLIKMKNEIRKEKEKYKESIDKISATLYSLRSFSKIRESFPEAAEFLPQQEIKSILNIKEIRGLLK